MMASVQTVFRLPASLPVDLDRLREQIELFEAGQISATELRAVRVPLGCYEQRESGTHMLRVRLPAGAVLPDQMRALAAVAQRHGQGLLHVTSRQDIQVHGVPRKSIHAGMVELLAAGLSTKGGGGNTVRNITACPDAGVCPREIFDVAPHAVALTEFLLAHPGSFQLPRKFKIAFSGCSADCAGAAVNDVGFIAKRRDGRLGFAVHVGGGMGSRSRVADLLEEFVATDEVHLVAEAVKRVFDQHGNRRDRHRARLRFLIRQIGFEHFRKLFTAELATLRTQSPAAPEIRELPRSPLSTPPSTAEPGQGFDAWRRECVRTQRQGGHHQVLVPLSLGDIEAGTLGELAEVVAEHGEGMLRTALAQNLSLRWVAEGELPALHHRLSALGLTESPPSTLREAITCAGASTCQLGICLSRGLNRAIRCALERSDLDLEEARDLRLHISGCPNACSRHTIGSIGLVGAARRIEGRLVPHYIVMLGGTLGEGRTRLAEGKEAVPARNVPAFLVEFLRVFRDSEQWPDFNVFLDAGGREAANTIAAQWQAVPSFEEDKSFYFDWGAEAPFSLAGRGQGECSAGVFDLIEIDLANAREALEASRPLEATELAARALLVTRGEEAQDSGEALGLFEKHFIDTQLVDVSFRPLIEEARGSLATSEPEKSFAVDASQVAALVEAVGTLHENMDQSLRFRPSALAGQTDADELKVDREADFQGVTCPLNCVKTKLLLEEMSPGQILSVLLDEAGGRNVPQSTEMEGHEVLSVQREKDQWRVIIRRG